MTFYKTGIFGGHWIESDLGFAVKVAKRDLILYREAKRQMSVTADVAANVVVLFRQGLGRWDDDSSVSVVEEEKNRILDNLTKALESQSFAVQVQ